MESFPKHICSRRRFLEIVTKRPSALSANPDKENEHASKSLYFTNDSVERHRVITRLIIPSPNDPDPKRLGGGRATYQSVIRFLFSGAGKVASTIALFIALAVPVLAHAGIFSFISGLFSGNGGSSPQIELGGNSQNMALLAATLNVDPNPLKGGGDVTIVGDNALLPDIGPLGTIADVEEESLRSGQISIYVVREGDSLSQIAKMFGISVNTVIWANDIRRGYLIRTGQTLLILPITGIHHSVEKGDTVAGIAKKYKGEVDEILQFNNLAEDAVLAVGETIVIPDGELGTSTYTETQSRVVGTGGPAYTGYYIAPVNGRRTQGLHGYNGVDLGAPYGSPVVAAASGNIIIARPSGWNGGYGTYAAVAHQNGTQTLYAHLSRLIVSAGTYVVQGQVIGYVGSSGRSTGPHLHFEVRGAQNPF